MKLHQFILSALKPGNGVSTNSIQSRQIENKTDDLRSVTVLFDLMRDQIADQQKQIDTLDTKASVILGAAVVFTGTVAAVFSGLVSSHAAILIDNRIWWLLPTLIVVFISLVFTTCMAYTVRRYQRVPDPQALYEDYRDKTEYFIKARVFTAMVKASKENENRIRKKVFWITCSIIGLGIEALILAVVLLFQIL